MPHHPVWQPGQAQIAAEGAAAPMDQSREAHRSARALHSPEGAMNRTVASPCLTPGVADDKRFSAVLAQVAQVTGERVGRISWPEQRMG